LAHAGRKSSAKLPWDGGGPLAPGAGAWTTAAPSGIPFDNRWPVPEALDEAGLARIRDAHAAAAMRAKRLGVDLQQARCDKQFRAVRAATLRNNGRNTKRPKAAIAASVSRAWPTARPNAAMTHNTLGRAYLATILPFHRLGVAKLLGDASAAGRI